MIDYAFKTDPFQHQKDAFLNTREKEYFALLMEQGTGKSKIIIDTGAYLYANGKIDSILIIAPNGVHRNWIINEIPAHCPDYIDQKSYWYTSSPKKKDKEGLKKVIDHRGLRIIAMNVEAMATKKGIEFAKDFVINTNCLVVVDESTKIKNQGAMRTKAVLKLAKHAKYRRILTGTPVTQGPLDIFTQFGFLDWDIIGESNYYAFRSRYAVLREMKTRSRSFMVVDQYVNLDELEKKISPHSVRVLKEDCLDLPEKLYQKHYVELSANQRRLYNNLKKEAMAQFGGRELTATEAMTKMLRLQQIVGGFFQEDQEVDFDENMNPIIKNRRPPTPIDKENPRIESLIELLNNTRGKVIIWSRFRAEIAAITQRIKDEFGDESLVEYHGGIDNEQRSENIQKFQNNKECRFFIGNVQAGAKGLTLHAASTVVYFSNNFSLEDRLQSEDRAHRIGQTKNVTYIDFIAVDTLDDKVVSILRAKKNIADMITGDNKIDNWI